VGEQGWGELPVQYCRALTPRPLSGGKGGGGGGGGDRPRQEVTGLREESCKKLKHFVYLRYKHFY
jgi:hypothetical protein